MEQIILKENIEKLLFQKQETVWALPDGRWHMDKMKIKTKYDVNDIVFFESGATYNSGQVTSIRINQGHNTNKVVYLLNMDYSNFLKGYGVLSYHKEINEDELYPDASSVITKHLNKAKRELERLQDKILHYEKVLTRLILEEQKK